MARKHVATVAPLAEYIRTYRLTRADLRTLARVTGTSLEALTSGSGRGVRTPKGKVRGGSTRGRSRGRAAKK